MKAAVFLMMIGISGVAHAQRDAVSAGLSPEMAAEAFLGAIRDVCVPGVVGGGVSSLAAARAGRVQPTQDADMRRQAGASSDETVWDVAAARGVVTVREGAGQCAASVYGPGVAPTIMAAMRDLSGAGFEAVAGAAGDGFTQTLLGESGGQRLRVQLSGAEPGAAGHRSRFSVITAVVSAVP